MTAETKPVRRVAVVVAVAGFALVSCSYDTGTGALAIGPDTYTMSKRYEAVGSSARAAEDEVLANANQYCTQAGRQFVPVSKDPTSGSGNPYGPLYFTVTFRCVAPSERHSSTDLRQSSGVPRATLSRGSSPKLAASLPAAVRHARIFSIVSGQPPGSGRCGKKPFDLWPAPRKARVISWPWHARANSAVTLNFSPAPN